MGLDGGCGIVQLEVVPDCIEFAGQGRIGLEAAGGLRIELSQETGHQVLVPIVSAHASSSRCLCSRARSVFSARAMRLLTVPTGISRILEISV